MKNTKYIYVLILSLILAFNSCQENDYEFGDIITPSNIEITAEIVGQDAANPDGDGSGVVNFTTTANNAISYKYVDPNGVEHLSLSGKQSISFSDLGLNTYTVNVVVSGTGGISASKTIQVQVLSTYSPPADLLDKLVGSGSRTWRIKAEVPGHFGLGPVGGTTPVEWYGAGPNEKDGLGIYDDAYIFNADGTFMHITNGTIFGRDPHIVNDLGPNTTGNVNGADIENYPYGDIAANWSITAPGGTETINLTGLAFLGYYTGGNHSYQIFNRDNPNEMVIKTTDAASDFDWWFIITSN
ncbi:MULTISPECIES: glucan endo-1,3-beta-D-glucosidase [Tenacibaculum]|uniref:glucan endo-1,3-beta-D-glucosidase n=1 Tax=Tenacibaculum TaxID=104267 RepID=UPI001F0A69EB|nr:MULTISPECIES: glucan endo-1,3-beta-D-glucosidase [Tenacibaculum]MCH3882011.1 glucan endo-1,3-beta-D-glucosidase [Tenacibaculum aquimarinum]MDO6601062.1 glucan endo-1,3-beta-D-glucosidase [Tenacibaculum sp. 1_MG-2023]